MHGHFGVGDGQAIEIEPCGVGERSHWSADRLAGVVRPGETQEWRARSGAWRIGRGGPLRDSTGKTAGARIATTASARNFGLLSRLGVEELRDYRTERFEDRVRPVDVVFDAVGGETLKRSWDLLKPAGRMVTIAADSERNADQRTEEAFFIVEPNQEQLAEIARLLDAAEIEPFVDCVVPFSEASEAYFGRIEGRRGYGKVVLSLTA